MGQTLSAPVTDKHTANGSNERFVYGASAMQGWRVSMEDAHTTLLNLKEDADVAFFAVFDGHGGQSAAKFAGANLAARIEKEPGYLKGEYEKAIKGGYLGLDYDLKTDPDFLEDVSGCTAVCALITKDNRIFVGNAGDSRAVLSSNGIVKELSFDHKPTNAGEHDRIYQAGGFVEYGRVNGNLALSRAIGDFEFKQNMRLPAEEQAVTADPDITEHQITEEDEFVVIACDGIWDCMTSQEVVTFVRERLARGEEVSKVCEQLMDQCLAPASDYGGLGCDNMTVVIVGLLNGKSIEDWQKKIASNTPLNVTPSESLPQENKEESGVEIQLNTEQSEDKTPNSPTKKQEESNEQDKTPSTSTKEEGTVTEIAEDNEQQE